MKQAVDKAAQRVYDESLIKCQGISFTAEQIADLLRFTYKTAANSIIDKLE